MSGKLRRGTRPGYQPRQGLNVYRKGGARDDQPRQGLNVPLGQSSSHQ